MAQGQDHPSISPLVHPPVIALLFILIAYFLGRRVPPPFVIPVLLRYLGLALTFVGFLLGIASLLEFSKARTTLNPHGSSTQVVTSGIYRFTRNPIYLGFLLMVIGLPVNSGLLWGLVLAPFYVWTMNRLVIQHEEAYLTRKFGNAYISYTSRVRRWL